MSARAKTKVPTATFAHLIPTNFSSAISAWLAEDTPSFDVGGYVVGEAPKTAVLYCKSSGVLAGVPFFNEVFRQVGCMVEWLVGEEGVILDYQGKRIPVAVVKGPARKILLGERVALNLLARCSGIATEARNIRLLADQAGFEGCIAGTRKTTPGFRLVEKYGLIVGGVDTHRMDLSSMVMLKDNHVWSTGSITSAVKTARRAAGFSVKIEVECRSEGEADEAIAAGTDIVMLDNMDAETLKTTAHSLKQRWATLSSRQVMIEASGGITVRTVGSYFSPDVDIISFGSLTQGVSFVDFSLKIQKE
ncbi:nicotinate-nucleotide diphosphorylase (carboxylating) [Spiromyces aspiralis]|uniref:Nicotinate-nucleotide diphosphorylase (Carboxylating) n=1 Tax=Spiromyces aspiralis TaxID=68401 RepID=A0ACC1HUE0_9FUNG|nr:nicotinate-nucleotide diphosphorylase (carboxylating) [Spiromyces aspiralis]